MTSLLDGARKVAYRVAARARRRLSGGDGGFVLLESIIAISLITVIMAAVGAEYVASVASVSRQRTAQGAAQVANSTLEQVRALRPSDLVAGRGGTSVATQFSQGNAISTVTPWLQQMDQASDANAPTTAGANATIPTCNPAPQGAAGPAQCTQKPGAVAYTVSQFIGTCWLVTSGTASNCVPAAQKTSSSVNYLRVVVAISWLDGACTAGCYYVTSTLVNASADPLFKANQPPLPAPVVAPPGDQNNDIGDAVNLQLGLVTGTGVPGYAWAITSGALPTGLSLDPSSGVISGVVAGPTGVQSVTVQVTDGYNRSATATFSWQVANRPAVTSAGNQVTAINTPVRVQVPITCPNTPCTVTLTNPPPGLSIDPTGVITGTPTTPGTTTTSVTVTDAAGAVVSSGNFTWTVLPFAPTCPTAVTLPNGSFETPGVSAGAGRNVGNGTSGLAWRTNNPNGLVEFWANGGNSQSLNGATAIVAQSGTQWVEVNGGGMDTLYQDLPTTPGQVLQWSLWHRARNATNNVDAQDSMQVQMGSTTQQSPQVPNGSLSPTISDGAAVWVQYTGTYVVPAGQTTTRFQVAATSTSSGNAGVGNFVDNVAVTGTPCLLSTPTAQTSTVNTAITPVQMTVSQGSGSYTWSNGSTLPAGLTLSSSGLITGTPIAVGTTSVSLIVTDSISSYQQVVQFTWTVKVAPTVSSPGNQTSSVGVALSLPVTSSCANSPCTYTITGGPAGLSINSSGVITGTPTTAGTSAGVTVTIRDAAGATATTASFTWTVKAVPTITTPGTQTSTVGKPVSVGIGSTCSSTPCSYTLGGAPAGLTINSSTGVITGTPTTAGTSSSVTVTITDAAGATATTNPFTWIVKAGPTITTPGNQTSTLGTAVNVGIGSSCPNTPCTYTLNGAPAGLTINSSTGVITGTPTTAGTSSSVTVTITDAAGATATTNPFTWTVKAAPTITTPANQTTSVGATVNLPIASSCANSPCTYTLNGAPTGLSINNSGVITGTPTTAGTSSSVTVTITDAAGATTSTTAFTWTVRAGPTITTPSNQTSSVGVAVSLTITSTCANSPCTYSASALPAGLSINSATGAITGTPTTTGTTTSTVTITDAAGATTSASLTWMVKAAPTVTTPSNQTSTIGRAVNVGIGSTCPNTPCTYTLTGAPAGLTINSSGVITGTPTTAGTSNSVTVTITDAAGATATTNPFTWTVKAGPTITTPSNQTSTLGTAVNVGIGSTCANTPCSYTLSGAPAGLTINSSTGVISGTPTTAGTSTSVTVTVTDAAGSTATTNPFSWTVKAAPTITTPSNQTGTVGVAVSLTVTSSCANSPCTYTLTGGPAGLSINSSGVITGTPTTAGTSNSVTVTITDVAGATSTSASFTWTVLAAPTVTAPANQTSSVGGTVNVTVASTCPNTPCTYTLDNPPAGLSMTGATITGTPTTAGTTTSTVTIRDAAGVTRTSTSFTWTIKAGPTVTAPANQTTSVGASVTLAVSSTCANTPCTYTVTSLPAGLTINANTGTITGTPTTADTTTTAITIRDNSGATATSAAFTWTVKAGPTINSPGNSNLDVGEPISYPAGGTCPNTPCTYTLAGAPAGLTINSATGVVSGAPTTPGVYNGVSATITDAAGATASSTPITVTVYARPTITSPGNQTGTINSALILPITSTCSNTPCTYALSGAPAGLSINSSTGRITGTPTAVGASASVKVTVTDAAGVAVDTATFSWTITAAPSVTSPGNQSTVNNAAVSLTLTKSCPDAPCAYRLNGGPAGLSITSAGVVTGTVTSAPRVFTGVSVTITDSAGATATSATFTWTVTAPLAGRWTMDEASGSTLADSSGGGHPATLGGSTYGRTTIAAQGANALTLNGSSASATASNAVLDASSSFTVSAWVRLNNTTSTQTFVSQDGTRVSSFALQYRTDIGRFAFSRTSADVASPTTTLSSSTAAPVVGQWYQVTGVFDDAADTLQLYVNGVQQGNPATYTTDWNGTGSFVIGRGKASSSSTNYVNGAIDDVRVYRSALSDDAVGQLAQAGYWRLDDGSGTTADDSSLNNFDGTVNGGATWTTPIVGASALQFNGSSATVTASSNVLDTSQSFSVSAWTKADTTTSTGAVVSADGANISSFLLRQDGTKWSMVSVASDGTNVTVTTVSATSNLVVGQWYHLVGVYNSVAKTVALYVNGVLQGSPASVTGSFKASGPLVIGRSYFQGGTNYFSGAIDDVHAFRFSLDQTGVTALATLTPPAPGAPTATAGSSSATVSWTAPTPVAGSPVTGYVVTPYLDGFAQTPISYSSTATSQTLTGLTTGGSYTFSVAAVNANGASAASPVSGSVLVS